MGQPGRGELCARPRRRQLVAGHRGLRAGLHPQGGRRLLLPDQQLATVKGAGYSFAIIKATEGIADCSIWCYVNPHFAGDWAGTKSAGIVHGAYHYFHPELSGSAQADYFIATINAQGGVQPGDLPPMLDWEEPANSSSPSYGMSVSAIVASAQAFLSRVQALTGRTALIYTWQPYWTGTLGSPGGFGGYPLMDAIYWSTGGVWCPDVPSPWTKWTIWQWGCCTVTVPGISVTSGSGCSKGPDVDTFNGSMTDLMNWTGAKPPFAANHVVDGYPNAMTSGDTSTATVTYQNTGTSAWTSSVHLVTTVPRGRQSGFAAPSWIDPATPAAAPATAAGAMGTFTFTLQAPEVSAPTTFVEHWGLSASGTAFGPPDGAVAFTITVTPRKATPAGPVPATPAGPTSSLSGGCDVAMRAPASAPFGVVLAGLLLALARRRRSRARR